ncbi:hypothetical protein TeGR_g5134, partial [Tetraparma gracilis]
MSDDNFDESPSRPMSGAARRQSKAAKTRLSSISTDHRTVDTATGGDQSGIGAMFVASRKTSIVDSTFRSTLARNNVDSVHLAEATTDQELKGWYMYDFANGAFFCSVLNFLPILIAYQASVMAK